MPIARTLAVLAALALTQQPALAGPPGPESAPVSVAYSAGLEQRFRDSYGEEDLESLRLVVVQSVERALARAGAAGGARVAVTIVDARPSHPTRRQLRDNPLIDPVLSSSLGGAELAATIRATDGRVLATLSARYFAPDLTLAAAAADPWADARVAIERFAAQLAARLARPG